jgi:hypothetical protein
MLVVAVGVLLSISSFSLANKEAVGSGSTFAILCLPLPQLVEVDGWIGSGGSYAGTSQPYPW